MLQVHHEEGRITATTYSNLIENREAGSTDGFTASGTVTLGTAYVSSQTYVSVVSTQAGNSTPGVFPIRTTKGDSIPVKPGENYVFKVLGYLTGVNNAYLYVQRNAGDLVWTGTALPVGSANENWVSSAFTIPTGVTSIKVGVLWNHTAVNDAIYINRVALYKTDFEYNYFITDQVGSPRVVLQTTPATLVYTATMETENQADETTKFQGINPAYVVASPGNTTPGGNEVIRLNVNNKIGPSKSIKVYPGDVVNATVYSYYTTPGGFSKTPLAAMGTSLAAAFGGVQSAMGDPGSIYANVTNAYGGGIAGLSPDQGATNPSAFLNYILFDKEFKPLAGESKPITATPNAPQLLTMTQVTASEMGYVYIYLSYDNLTGTDVYFDDLKITHQESPVIQVNNYYPFGMVSYAWLREGEIDNAHLFQGKELISQTGWHDFGSRMYYGELGRWFANDPQGKKMPYIGNYSAMMNNPVIYIDPDGECPICIAALIGGLVNLGVKAYQGKIHSFGDGFAAFGIGAAAGAFGAWTGGAAFAAMVPSGTALTLGAGGFAAGFVGGTVGAAAAMPLQSLGNSLYFGDPFMTLEEYGIGILTGGLLGGTINGVAAWAKGLKFGNGQPIPGPSTTPRLEMAPFKGPKVEMGKLDVPKIPNSKPVAAQTGVEAPELPGNVRLNTGDFKSFPPNNGFANGSKEIMLEPGQIIDRVGSETGYFLSPKGTPLSARSLPPAAGTKLSTYQVIKPFPVQSGQVAPWFTQPGGGIQYLSPVRIIDLIDLGYIIRR